MSINWKSVQAKLGVTADGIVGPATMGALLNAITRKKVSRETALGMLKAYNEHEINTPNRLASFIAQTAHESGGYTVTSENLNYGAKGLRTTFGKYFTTDALAKAYERKPEKIANRVYANRMSNGSEDSGDGWRFRGAGYIQLTGRANFTAFAKWMGLSIDEALVYARTGEGAVLSALYYWTVNNINRYADTDNIIGQRKAVNGGLIGVKEVVELYNRGKELLT